MKLEKLRTSLAGMLLSFAVSCGAAGCLMTAFELNVNAPEQIWLVCGITAFVCGVCCLRKWGGAAVLCLLAAWAGYLWHRGEAGMQILQLIYRISYIYDRAYGWGVLQLVDSPWNVGAADLPLQILGCGIALAAGRTVCRGKRTWPAVILSLAPLLLCLVVTDTVPEEKYLFWLLLGVLLLVMTASVRRFDPGQSGRLIWLLALPVAAALGLLFYAVPQESYVNQSEEVREKILAWVESLPEKVEDTTREIAAAMDGSDGETVNLKTLGRQSSLAYPVLEVTSDCGGTVYLRSQDYDSYTGTGWTATPHRSEEFGFAGESAGMVRIETRSGWKNRLLPYYPRETAALVGGSVDNPDREKEYSIARYVLPDNWRSLVKERSQGNWESEIVFTAVLEATNYLDSARYLLLPNETKARAKQLLETILDGQSTATEEAEAIAAYVRSSAKYDRDTGRMPQEEADFALWFLEESETGYCVHFATAAVVLLRAANVPARYVTGYMVTCGSGETVTVTADMAHAWAEYYEPQLACWIPLEATPSDGLPQTVHTEQTQPQAEVSQPSETHSGPGETISVPVQTEIQMHPTNPETPKKQFHIPTGWLWLAAAVLLLFGQRPVRLALRRRRREAGSPNDRALALWREAELLAKLQKEPAPQALEALAQKAKFSQHTLAGEELAQMEDYVADSVEALREKPWYQRIVHQLIFAAY